MRVTAVLLSSVMILAPTVSFAQSVPPGVTQIIPDGRTATTVTTNGNVSNVTTNTVSGPNAFNSFSQFRIGSGNTGNLILPNGTSNLINMVHDGPVVVNGILNGYKNGQIGGNIYFADPHGFVVGRSGVVNVGALNVSTPTREFMDSVISPSGQINQGAVNSLLAGTVPVSPDGTIRIRGRVNAVDAVRLTGQNVFVGSRRDAINRDHAVKFASSVNSKGLHSANAIVVRNGSIQIVASNNAKINSRLVARKSSGAGGDIVVLAGKAIRFGGRAKLDVRGRHADAGNIVVRAGQALTVTSGAQFDASSTTAAGGFVELSSFGSFSFAKNFKINLSGANGKNGVFLIDPNDQVIGDPNLDAGVNFSNADVANAIAAVSDGTFRMEADSITIAQHGVIDTRRLGSDGKSVADSFNVELKAPVIKVYGQILANAENTATSAFKDGNISLIADVSTNLVAGDARADTSIELFSGSKIVGANIDIGATSKAVSSYVDSAAGFSALVIQSFFANAIGFTGGYVSGTSHATVSIKDGATIIGSGDVTIGARGIEKASDPAITASPIGPTSPPVGVAVVVGQVSGTVNTTVESNATIKAGGSLSVTAENEATLSVSAIGISDSAEKVATVAYGSADVTTNAVISTGANISVGQNLYVGANNVNSFTVSATSYALGTEGKVGAAVAVSEIATAAKATLGADVKNSLGNAIAGSVLVESNSHMPSSSADAINSTHASATVGNPILVNALIAAGSKVSSSFNDFITTKARDAQKADAKDAGALTLAFSDQSATASIEKTAGGAAAPVVKADGNVAVVANVSDAGVSSLADASTNSQQVQDRTTQSSASKSVALGVAIGQFSHNATAYIGQGVDVCCANIGVSATTDMPITITWLTYDNASTWLGKINGNLGAVGEVLTSYANATSEAQDNNRVGAANYFEVNNSATAWVASDATLTRNSATAPANWTTTLSDNSVVTWQQAVAVQASTRTASIDIGGNFSWLGLTGTSGQQNGNGQNQAKSVGGAANIISYNSDAVAGIGDGVTVDSNAGLAVSAKNENAIFSVAPTSGAGSGSTINGIVAVAVIADLAHASISNTAKISAPTVAIDASEVLSILSLGGAVGSAQNDAVGIVVAANQVDADTAAYIGSNKADIADSSNTDIDPGAASTATDGYVHTDNIALQAQTYGIVTAASVAATEASGSQSSGSTFLKKFASKIDKAISGSDKADQKTQDTTGTSTTPKWSIDLSGSSSVNVVDANTAAYIQGARIDRLSGSTATTVQSVNNTILQTGAGSGALDMAKNQATKSAAVAGALAISITSNTTNAYIANSNLTNAASAQVLALQGGEQMTVGLGLALNQSANQQQAKSIAGSISIAISTDSVAAYVSDSAITADPALSLTYANGFTVAAYQTTDIGIGGGSLYKGGKTGFGLAVTYAAISDPGSGVLAVDAHVSNSSVTGFYNATVLASDASRIGAGAGLFGYAQNALAISLVITDISPTISAIIDGGPSGASTISVAGDTQSHVVQTAYRVTSDTPLTDTADTHYTLIFSMPDIYEAGVTHYTYNVVHTDTTTLHGDVTVASNGSRNAAFDATIANAGNVGSDPVNTGLVDFSGSAVDAANSNSGASIIAIAGVVQGGQNSLGFAISANRIHQNNVASITHATVTASHGDVVVTADSSADIIGVAIGAALSQGQGADAQGKFAGLASSTINLIQNGVSATIGDDTATPANTSVTANNVYLRATDDSNIRGAAGTLAISTQGSAAGVSIVYDSISNSVMSGINGAKVLASQDVSVLSSSDADILTIALGIAGSKQVSVAGSVAMSIMNTNVTSSITNSADVAAGNNVGVLASNDDVMAIVAGTAGIGLTSTAVGISVVVNEVTGRTAAFIGGANTRVDAYAAGANSLSVNSGTLNTAFDVSTPDNPNLTPPDLSETQKTIHGLAVVATSHQAIDGVAVTLGLALGASAGAINPVTSLMGGSTDAYIDSAQINTRDPQTPSAATAQNVFVGASSQTYARNLLVAGAGASGFAGAAAINSTRMDRDTHAYITDATVGTATRQIGDVAVNAASTQVTSAIAVGLAVGTNSFGGSLIVNVFAADTQAYVTHGTMYASTLGVTAASENGFFASAGAGAGAASVGVAAGFAVGASENTTAAYIGDDTAPTSVNLTGDLSVAATSKNTFYTYAIGGAGAGGAGIAGMVAFTVLDNHTIATIDNAIDTQTGAGSDTNVSATEYVTIRSTTGAGAAGGNVGLGAAVNVVVMKSQIAAGIIDSSIDAKNAVSVTALGVKDVDMETYTVGIGAGVGIAASIGLLIAGIGAPGDAIDQIGTTVQTVQDESSNVGGSDNGVYADTVPGNTQAAPARPSGFSLTSALGSNNDGVSAEITGGSVTANSVAVSATGKVKTKNVANGVGVGGLFLGIGAALGFTLVYDTISASVAEGTVHTSSISVTAAMQDNGGHVADVEAAAGAGSLFAAIGAAVAIGTVNNTVSATVGGNIIGPDMTNAATSAVVSASDSSSIYTQAVGAAVATEGGALGVSVATSTKSSLIYATVLEGSSISGFYGMNVTATGTGSLGANSIAGAGGVIAGTGAGASSTDNENVIAEIGSSAVKAALDAPPPVPGGPVANITVGGGGLWVNASSTPETDASAVGVAVGAAGVGASVGIAKVNTAVSALVDDNSVITTAGLLKVEADALRPTNDDSAHAFSAAGTGGYLLGANATVSEATNNATVLAAIGDGVVLPLGDVTVLASNTTSQSASTTGVAAGFVAVGVSVANANSNSSTTASLGKVTSPTNAVRLGALNVQATGADNTSSEAVSGAGGVVAGNGAAANINNNATVLAKVAADANVVAGTISVTAQHTTTYKTNVNAVNASAFGASGATAASDLAANVTVDIGAGAHLTALGAGCIGSSCSPAINLVAQSNFVQSGTGDSATGAGGGVLNGAGVSSRTDIDAHAVVKVGDGAHINSGTDVFGNPGSIRMTAFSTLNATDSVSLVTGGAIASAGVNSTVNATMSNDVTIGVGAQLFTYGSIGLGTFTQMAVNTGSYVSTYGIAAIGAARTNVILADNEKVTIDPAAQLLAFGNINLTPGRDPGGDYQSVLMTGTSDAQAYVRGLIAIPVASAVTRLTTSAELMVDANAKVLAGQHVELGAYPGTQTPVSHGDAHGYILFLIPVATSDSSREPSQSAKVTINDGAQVTAGYFHEQTVTIDCGATTCGPTERPIVSSTGAPLTVTDFTDPAHYFDVSAYVAATYDKDVRDVLLTSMAKVSVPTLNIGTLFASGGSVTIAADLIAGTGTVTAYGGPKITVTANTPAYLIFNGAYIPDLIGGQVNFTGKATQAPVGMTINAIGSGAVPQIVIANNYTGITGSNSGSTGFGPAMLFAGDVTNLGGTVTINNLGGSYGSTGNTNAQGIELNVPNGAAVISNPDPGGYYGPVSAFAAYNNAITYPGGTPGGLLSGLSADAAIEYVANVIFQAVANASGQDLSTTIYGHLVDGTQHFGPLTQTTLFYGNCIPGYSGTCTSNQRSGFDVAINGAGGQYILGYDTDTAYLYPSIPFHALSLTSSATAPTPTKVQTFGGGNVAIKAAVIDVNAKIVIGRPTAQSIVIPASVQQQLAGDLADYHGKVATNPAVDSTYDITNVPDLPNRLDAATRGIGTAYYDAKTNQIIVTDTNASSSGGRLTMTGAIVSTSTFGNIQVNGGLGQITIDNQTNVPIVVNKINTGNPSVNGDVVSTIKIKDTLKPLATNTTTYVYTAGKGVATYVTADGIDADPVTMHPASFDASGAASYSPVSGARLQWVQQAQLTRNVDQTVPSPWAWKTSDDPNNPWQFVTGAALTDPNYRADTFSTGTASQAHPQGIVVMPGDPSYPTSTGANVVQTITGGVTRYSSSTGQYYYSYIGERGLFGGLSWHGSCPCNTNDGDATQRQMNLPTEAWLKLTTSVKADNPFAIQFNGQTVGSVSITSKAPVILTDQFTNSSGLTTITAAGSITQGANAFVQTKSLQLDATDGFGAAAAASQAGAIGSAGRSFAATLNGGTVNAQAGAGGVYLAVTGSSTVRKVAAVDASGYGDIVYKQSGDLLAASGASAVPVNFIGSDINLISIGGKIGKTGAPIVISAHGTQDQTGLITGGEVNATAQGDINLTQTSGISGQRLDLRLGTLTSLSGDVSVTVVDGALVDARGQSAADVLSTDQVNAIAQLLHLTGSGAAQAAIDNSVKPFEAQINANYVRYFRLKSDGCTTGCTAFVLPDGAITLYRPLVATALQNPNLTDAQVAAYIVTLHQANGTLNLADGALALYRPLAAAAFNIDVANVTDAQVRAYADSQYQGIVTNFTRAYGTGWASLAQFQGASPQASYKYSVNDADATPGIAAVLTDRAVWDPAQLVAGIDQTAFQPVSPTVGNGTPNIVGRNVTLNVGGSVGVLADPVPVALNSLIDGGNGAALTGEQKAAIAAANTPGSVVPVGVDSHGVVVKGFSIASIPVGVTVTGVEINRQAPVFVAATGTFSANATAAAYVQSTGAADLSVGQVVAGGNVALTSPKGILAAMLNGNPLFTQQVLTAGGLSLTAGNGDIGGLGAAFGYKADGNLIAAQASGNVYLASYGRYSSAGGDMNVGRVFAGGTAQLTAETGSILGYLAGLAIIGHDVVLESVSGDLGSSANLLQVQTNGGQLTGRALVGGAYLNSPTVSGQAPVAFTVASLETGGALTVTADSDLTALNLVSTVGDIVVGSGANGKVVSAVTSAQGGNGTITATALGALEIGSLAGTGAIKVQAGGDVTVTAGGVLNSTAGLVDISGASLVMGANSMVSAAQTVAVTTIGDAVLGQLLSSLSPVMRNTTAVSVTAGDATHDGRILSNGDGQTNILTVRPNAATVLSSIGDIGQSALPVSISSPWLSAVSAKGDIHIAALGDVHVKNVSAGGSLDLTTTGALIFDQVKGDTLTLKSNGVLNVEYVEVANSVTLIGTEITGTIAQTPGATGPLQVSIMGPNGTLARNAVVVIDPPQTVMPQLRVVDATIVNDGPSFTVLNGLVAGQFTLTMLGQTFVMNNRSPAPMGWPAVQLYQNGDPFSFSQIGFNTYTSGFIVDYGQLANVTALGAFNGMSFVRDVPRDMWEGSPFDTDDMTAKKNSGFHLLGKSPSHLLDAFQLPKAVETVGNGPAVNIGGR